LSLKIGDIIFHNSSEGKAYATVTIGKDGKIIPRTLPIIYSIPYLKEWLTRSSTWGKQESFLVSIDEQKKHYEK